MKVTYLEEVESRTAFSRKMLCPCCGSHMYKVIHQIQPWPDCWRIECEECGAETKESPTRATAKLRWKHGVME